MEVETSSIDSTEKAESNSEPKGPEGELVKEYVISLLNRVKSNSPKEVYNALHIIRSRVILTEEGISMLHECGGFKYLVKILSVSKEDILNIAVSILGNCCSRFLASQELRDEVMKYDIAARVTAVLGKVTRESVQKRLFRLIGNLAQAHTLARSLHRANITLAIMPILSTTESSAVKQMAVRALRWLWEVDKYHGEMLKAGVVKAVVTFLETSDDEELLPVVLRALVVFSQPCNNLTADQMRGNGEGYARIVSKMNLPIVCVLICNLSHSPVARVELSKAGIVPQIVAALQDGKINSYLTTALCLMCRESMVRASLRSTPRGFQTLLSFLSNKNIRNLHLDVINAIYQFSYDQQSLMEWFVWLPETTVCRAVQRYRETGSFKRRPGSGRPRATVPTDDRFIAMQVLRNLFQTAVETTQRLRMSLLGLTNMMVQEGLIGVLVGKLDDVVKSGGGSKEHEETSEVGELAPVSPVRSPVSWSPPREYSASSTVLYSPRCSSPEPEDESMPSITNPGTPNIGFYGIEGEDGCILDMLSQLTYQNVPLRPLAARATVATLLDYLVTLRYPSNRHNYVKASKTLSAIVSCKHYYNSLLEEESILAIHRELCRPKHSDCSQCQRLDQTGRIVLRDATLAAQSGLGEGEMSYRLAMATDTVKSTVALTIPYVVRQPNLLHNLLFSHNAFQSLLDALETRIVDAVPALHELFLTLGIPNPQMPTPTCTQCDIARVRKESNVRFSLDDGSTVSANRESLSHWCPVFEAMFRGGFVESQQATIRLTDISADCLTHLTRLADGFCHCLLPRALPTLLEMVTVTDRLLLPDLNSTLMSYIMNCVLSDTTVEGIYDWGVRLGDSLEATKRVAEEAVSFLLVAEMRSGARVDAVRSILESHNRARLIEDMTRIVKTGLHSYLKSFHPSKLQNL